MQQPQPPPSSMAQQRSAVDARWKVRACYLPAHSVGLAQRTYSDALCIEFLCAHLQSKLRSADTPGTAAHEHTATDEISTPNELWTMMRELADTIVRVGAEAVEDAGADVPTLPLSAPLSDQLVKLLCTLLAHPEPLVRAFALQLLADPLALHFAVSCSRASHLRLQRSLRACWAEDEMSFLRSDVLDAWDALFGVLLRGEHLPSRAALAAATTTTAKQVTPLPAPAMEFGVQAAFDDLVRNLSDMLISAPLPDAASASSSASAASASEAQITAQLLTLASDPGECEKLHLLRLLAQMLEASASCAHVQSNLDLVFYLLLESLKHPQCVAVQRAIFKLLSLMSTELKLLRALASFAELADASSSASSSTGAAAASQPSALGDFLNVVALFASADDEPTRAVAQQLMEMIETAQPMTATAAAAANAQTMGIGRISAAQAANTLGYTQRMAAALDGPTDRASIRRAAAVHSLDFSIQDGDALSDGQLLDAAMRDLTVPSFDAARTVQYESLSTDSARGFLRPIGPFSGLEKLQRINPHVKLHEQRPQHPIPTSEAERRAQQQQQRGGDTSPVSGSPRLSPSHDGATASSDLSATSLDSSSNAAAAAAAASASGGPSSSRDPFSTSNAATQILRNRIRLASKLRAIMRVTGNHTTLVRAADELQPRNIIASREDHEPDDSKHDGDAAAADEDDPDNPRSTLYTCPTSSLLYTAQLKAMLPPDVLGSSHSSSSSGVQSSSHSLVMSLVVPSFPGVPSNATTVPPVRQAAPEELSEMEALEEEERLAQESKRQQGEATKIVEAIVEEAEDEEEDEDASDEESDDDDDDAASESEEDGSEEEEKKSSDGGSDAEKKHASESASDDAGDSTPPSPKRKSKQQAVRKEKPLRAKPAAPTAAPSPPAKPVVPSAVSVRLAALQRMRDLSAELGVPEGYILSNRPLVPKVPEHYTTVASDSATTATASSATGWADPSAPTIPRGFHAAPFHAHNSGGASNAGPPIGKVHAQRFFQSDAASLLIPDAEGLNTRSKTMLGVLTPSDRLRAEIERQAKQAAANGPRIERSLRDLDREGPRDFRVGALIRLEVRRVLNAQGQPLPLALQDTTTFEARVRDSHRSVLAQPMSVQGAMYAAFQHGSITRDPSFLTGGGSGVGTTFMIQASDKLLPHAFWDVSLEVERVLNDQEYIRSVLAPNDEQEEGEESSEDDEDEQEAIEAADPDEDEEARKLRLDEAELLALEAEPDDATLAGGSFGTRSRRGGLPGHASRRPIPPAGLTTLGAVPFFYPPSNLPPVPVAYDAADGLRPIFELPPEIKPTPEGYTEAGRPFYKPGPRETDDNEDDDVARMSPAASSPIAASSPVAPSEVIHGYTRSGVPFTVTPGSTLPRPSGYTRQGVPYYLAASLLKFMEDDLVAEEEEEEHSGAIGGGAAAGAVVGPDGKLIFPSGSSASGAAGSKLKPFFKVVLTKRRLKFVAGAPVPSDSAASESAAVGANLVPFDKTRSLAAQLAERAAALAQRMERDAKNEEDGVVPLPAADPAKQSSSENRVKRQADMVRFSLLALGSKDAAASSSSSSVSSPSRRSSHHKSLSKPLLDSFTPDQKSRLKFRVSAVPSRFFRALPELVDLTEGSTNLSPDISVEFDATLAPPSSNVEGKLVVRWEDGTLLGHMPLQARTGPFLSVVHRSAAASLASATQLSAEEANHVGASEGWCAIGSTRRLTFQVRNVTDEPVSVALSVEEMRPSVSPEGSTAAPSREQYYLDSLSDESFDLPAGASRDFTVCFSPRLEGVSEALLHVDALGGAESHSLAIVGVGGLPVQFQILQGDSALEAAERKEREAQSRRDARDNDAAEGSVAKSGDKPASRKKPLTSSATAKAAAAQAKQKREDARRLLAQKKADRAAVDKAKKQARAVAAEMAAAAAAASGTPAPPVPTVEESDLDDDTPIPSEPVSSDFTSSSSSAPSSDEDLSPSETEGGPRMPLASTTQATIMQLDLSKAEKSAAAAAANVTDVARALRDAENGLSAERAAELQARLDRRARKARARARPRYRPLSASAMSFFQESLDAGGRDHFVDFGIVDSEGPPQLRAISMQNLLSYKVVIVVRCRSAHFDVRHKFLEIPAKGAAKIPVTFQARPGMDGLVSGSLEVFWQDSSHTVFHLQAFVGQPIVFNLAPRAYFAPCSIGDEQSMVAVAYNRSPYHLIWDCIPFGEAGSLAEKSFRQIHRSRSQQGVREGEDDEEVELAAAAAASSSSTLQSLAAAPVVAGSSDKLVPLPVQVAAALNGRRAIMSLTQLSTHPYANTAIHLVFSCNARGIVAAPLGIRLLMPHRADYQACRTHAVLLIGIGMQASYTLPLSLISHSPDAAGGSSAVPDEVVSLAESAQSQLLNAFNLDFGGSDIRSDLARLQQWCLGMTNTVSAAAASIPAPVAGTVAQYKSRMARPRFTVQPTQLSLLGRWKPGDREEDTLTAGASKREIVAMWQLMASAASAAEKDDFVVLRTPGLTLQPWQGSIGAEIAASSAASQPGGGARLTVQPDGSVILPGTVSFHPAPGPTEYTVFEGFLLAVSLRDRHFVSVPIHAERSHGVLVSPERMVTFPRVVVDSKETEYILLRSRMLAPVTWTLTFPSSAGFNSFVVPVNSGRLEPSETEVVRLSFEPNAQGHYKEVVELAIRDVASGGLVLVRELLLSGTGHAPHIGGFPRVIDFGNVALGWVGFMWLKLRNHGFVDDEVNLYAPAPFLVSDTIVRIKAKGSVRVCLFFAPTRAASIKKAFTILAGGKVVRIVAKGRGGTVDLQCKSKETAATLAQKQAAAEAAAAAVAAPVMNAASSEFPPSLAEATAAATAVAASAAANQAASSGPFDRCHIDFGTAQMETLVTADLHLSNVGSLPVRLTSVPLSTDFLILSEGVFSNLTSKQVEISTKANRWAMISTQKTGVTMALSILEAEKAGATGGKAKSHQRQRSTFGQTVAEVVQGRPGHGRRGTKMSFSGNIHPSSQSAEDLPVQSPTPVLLVPAGHTLRLQIEFRPRKEMEFDFPLVLPFTEEPTQPTAGFGEEEEQRAAVEREENRVATRASKQGIATGIAENPFAAQSAASVPTAQGETESGYFDLSNVSPELALYFAFMRRREQDEAESNVAAEVMGLQIGAESAAALALAAQPTNAVPEQLSAGEKAILAAYRKMSLDELRDMAGETDLYAALKSRSLVDPSIACVRSQLTVRMSGGCYGCIELTPHTVNFGPVPAGRFLIATNRSNSTQTGMLAHRTGFGAGGSKNGRRAGMAGDTGMSRLRKVSLMLPPSSSRSIASSSGRASGWASRRRMGPDVPEGDEEASGGADLIPGLLPSELQSTLLAEEEPWQTHPAFATLSEGVFQMRVHNGSIHAQTLTLEYIKPACFQMLPHPAALPGPTANVFDLPAGSNLTLDLLFTPHETNTVYMGVAVFSHLFGTLTIPLRGVGSAAHVAVIGLAPADTSAMNSPIGSPRSSMRRLGGLMDAMAAAAMAFTSQASTLPLPERTEGLTDSKKDSGSTSPSTAAEAPLGSSSRPLGGRYALRFPPVKLHTLSGQTFTLRNQGLLPARYVITCSSTPFSLEEPNTRKDVSVLRGVLGSNETLKVKATCLLFVKQREQYNGELTVKWQLVPRGIWVEERVELSAKVGRPLLQADVSVLDFGSVVLHRPAMRKFLLRNGGDAVLEWDGEIAGISAAEDNLVGHGRSAHAKPGPVELVPRSGIIRPNHAAVIRVLFQPQALEPLQATLRLLSDGGESAVQLHGSVLVPQLVVPSRLGRNFGIVRVGEPTSYSFELFNSGTTSLQYLIYLDEQATMSGAGAVASKDGEDAEEEEEELTLMEQVREAGDLLHEEMLELQAAGAGAGASPRVGDSDAVSAFGALSDLVDDPIASLDGLRHLDSLDPASFDRSRQKSEAQSLARGQRLPDAKKPLAFHAYSVYPWQGSLMPRTSTAVEISVNPKEIGVRYVVRLVVAPGIVVTETTKTTAAAGKSVEKVPPREVFQSMDLFTGVLACMGGGAELSVHAHHDRAKFSSWETDLCIDPAALLLPGIIPLGLLMTVSGGQATPAQAPSLKSGRVLSIRNSGNLPGSFVIEPIGGNNERLERTLLKEESKAGITPPPTAAAVGRDDTVFTVFPLSGTVAPGETLWLTLGVTSTRLGFLQQQYRVFSPDSSSLRENFTILAYGGETKLEWVGTVPVGGGTGAAAASTPNVTAQLMDVGVCQIGSIVSRQATLRNSGNQHVSFTVTLVHTSRSDAWARDPRRMERLAQAKSSRRTTRTKLAAVRMVRGGAVSEVINEDMDEKHDASSSMASSSFPPTDTSSASAVSSLPLPAQSPFRLVQPASTIYKVAPHGGECNIELQYLPLEDGMRDEAELRLEWLGPPLTMAVSGAAGTGALEIVYAEDEAGVSPPLSPAHAVPAVGGQLAPLHYGLRLLGQTHWKTVLVRNTGTLDLEFRLRVSGDGAGAVPSSGLVSFKTPTILTSSHRVAAKRSYALAIGLTPTFLTQANATVHVTSSGLPELAVPLTITGARFACELNPPADQACQFGEVSVEARAIRTITLRNTGDLPGDFLIELDDNVRGFITVPFARIKRTAIHGAPSSSSADGDWDQVVANEVTASGAAIAPTSTTASGARSSLLLPGSSMNRRTTTMAAMAAIKRATNMEVVASGSGSSSDRSSAIDSAALLATFVPKLQYFTPLKLSLHPGDEAEIEVAFLSLDPRALEGSFTISPQLPSIPALSVSVAARASWLKLSLDDTREISVGKIMLNHVSTVRRIITNHTKSTALKFRMEFRSIQGSTRNSARNSMTAEETEAGDLDRLADFNDPMSVSIRQVWSVTPATGTLAPGTSIELCVSYNSMDRDESNWHAAQLRVLNLTQGTVDARVQCLGSVAFPRLSMMPLDEIDPRSVLSRVTTPRRATSPLMEEPESSTSDALGLNAHSASQSARASMTASSAAAPPAMDRSESMTLSRNQTETYFDFGVRALHRAHPKPFAVRNQGTGSIDFVTKITLTKRTHFMHTEAMARMHKDKPVASGTLSPKIAPAVKRIPSGADSSAALDRKPSSRQSAAVSRRTSGVDRPALPRSYAPLYPEGGSEVPLDLPFFLLRKWTDPAAMLTGYIGEKARTDFLVVFRPLTDAGEYHAVLEIKSEAGVEHLHLRGRGCAFTIGRSIEFTAGLRLYPSLPALSGLDVVVLDFGRVFLGAQKLLSLDLENTLSRDFNAAWMSFLPRELEQEEKTQQEEAAATMEKRSSLGRTSSILSRAGFSVPDSDMPLLMRLWSELLASQGHTPVKDAFSLTEMLQSMINEEKQQKSGNRPTAKLVAALAAAAESASAAAAAAAASAPTPAPTLIDSSSQSAPPSNAPIRRRPKLARFMSVDLVDSEEEDVESEQVGAASAVEIKTTEASAPPRPSAADIAAALDLSLRKRWTRSELCFAFFPESIFLGPRDGVPKKEAVLQVNQPGEDPDADDATFITGVDVRTPAVEQNLVAATGGAMQTLAQLNPPPRRTFEFRIHPPVEYERVGARDAEQRLPLFNRMLSLASIEEAGKLYTRTLLVRTLSSSFLLQLRASLCIHPVLLSRSSIPFHTTLTNSPLFKRFSVTNPANYPVPVRIQTSHAVFTADPAATIIPASSTVEIVVRFLSSEPFDTADAATFPVLPSLTVSGGSGILSPLSVSLSVKCTDYVFSTRLFKDIAFGIVWVKASCEGQIMLHNVTLGDVEYKLSYDKSIEGLSVARADQSGRVRADAQKKVVVRFDPREPQDLDTVVGIETRAGVFNIRVTGRAIVPSIATSVSRLAFGVVGVGYTVERQVTVTNTCLLPLKIYARPTEVPDEAAVLAAAKAKAAAKDKKSAEAEPEAATAEGDESTKPQAFFTDLPRAGVLVEPGASFEMRVNYAPCSTPVFVDPLAAPPVDPNVYVPPVLSAKMKARAQSISVSAGSRLSASTEPSSSSAAAAPVAAPRLPDLAEADEQGSDAADSGISFAPTTAAAAPVAPVFDPTPRWEFPTDRFLIPFFADQHAHSSSSSSSTASAALSAPPLASIACVGRGGLLDLSFSHTNIEFGAMPSASRRKDEIVLRNRGDVPVLLAISAAHSDTISHVVQAAVGQLSVHVEPGSHPSLDVEGCFLLSPGSSRTLLVELSLHDRGGAEGPFRLPFRLNLCGVATRKSWHLSVGGFVEGVEWSRSMDAFLRDEQLPALTVAAVEPNEHLARVLARVDYVPSVSIQHELAMVEPTLPLPTLLSSLAMPAALAPAHLQSFKRWYHDRAPLRMTAQQDPFKQLQDMLENKTVQRHM